MRKVNFLPEGVILALKTIALDLKDEKVRRQIVFELQKLYDFDCPYIVTFHGAFLSEGAIHIALEYMDGSLHDVKKRLGHLEEDVLAAITRQVLLGLKYLHEQHIIHRDIKPGNILINCFGDVKIADFGVSGEVANSMAKCQSWVGTTTYMSPERIKGESYGYDSDLWALGISLMELRTGIFPFPVETVSSFFDLLDLIVVQPSPRLTPAQASPELADFVARCLEKNPAQRTSAEKLLSHPWLAKHERDHLDMRRWFLENMMIPEHAEATGGGSRPHQAEGAPSAGGRGLTGLGELGPSTSSEQPRKLVPLPPKKSTHSASVSSDDLARHFSIMQMQGNSGTKGSLPQTMAASSPSANAKPTLSTPTSSKPRVPSAAFAKK